MRPIAPANAGIGARSRPWLGAKPIGSDGGCSSSPANRHARDDVVKYLILVQLMVDPGSGYETISADFLPATECESRVAKLRQEASAWIAFCTEPGANMRLTACGRNLSAEYYVTARAPLTRQL